MYNKLEMLIEYAKIIENLIRLDGDQYSDGNVIDMISTVNNAIINEQASLPRAVQQMCTHYEINIKDIVSENFLHFEKRRYDIPLETTSTGKFYPIQDREACVSSWGFVSSDWSWYWSKDGKHGLDEVFETTKEDADGVLWFNK